MDGDVNTLLHLSRFWSRWWWVFVGAFALLFVLGYMVQFAPAARWHLSTDTEDWARLGEYTGGVFGVFAFIGVLITIDLQRKQLNQQSDQLRQATNKATVDELMQLCRALSKSIDDALAQPLPDVIGVRETEFVVWANCSTDFLGLVKAANSTNPRLQEQLALKVTDRGGDLRVTQTLDKIAGELDQLASCVQDLIVWGGSAVIENFYRDRYRDAAKTILKFDVLLNSAWFWSQQNEKTHPL
jgi:hypothetical protein